MSPLATRLDGIAADNTPFGNHTYVPTLTFTFHLSRNRLHANVPVRHVVSDHPHALLRNSQLCRYLSLRL
jgi:hypothetical protein